MAAGRTSSRSRINPPLRYWVRSLSGSPFCWDLAAVRSFAKNLLKREFAAFWAKLATV